MKTFRKAIAIMLTLVFMLSFVPVSGMAEDAVAKSAKVYFSNAFYARSGSYSGAIQNYTTYIRGSAIASGYLAFFQLDFSGMEYLLRDAESDLKISIQGNNSGSAKTYDFKIVALDDYSDSYANVYRPYDESATIKGICFNDVSALIHTNASGPVFASRTDSSYLGNAVYTSDADKHIVLDALDSSKDDSVVTFEYFQGPNHAAMKDASGNSLSGKSGIIYNSPNTFVEIVGASEEATPQAYVNDVADMITWNFISDESIRNVSSNLNLPKKHLGVDIDWESSNDNAIIASSGEVVVNHEENTYVTLTATFTYKAYTGESVTTKKEFDIRIPGDPYDYSKGSGTYHDGNNSFVTRGSGGNHVGSASIVTGIAGKEDSFYKLQDALGKSRYDLSGPTTAGNSYRNIIEFSICVPSDAYGYANVIRVYTGKDATDSTSANSELNYKNDGIYLSRGNKKLVAWDGSKWHHVAVQVPGIVSSDADGIVYDRTFKIYVDGICEYNLSVEEKDFPAPHGIQYVQTNGLCPEADYTEDKVWDTVACYLDNLRWTHDAYVPEYNTLSNVTSASYQIDDNNLITITNSGVTVADLEADLTIDEDAVIRVYNAAGVLVEDKSQKVADGYTVVVADTNGTTAERSYAYYSIRVIEDGTMEFDASVIESEDGNVNGSVKLYNNTDAAKTYDVYLVVYSEKEAVTVLEPVTLSVDGGNVGTVDTASVAFANGNIAKVLVWEQGTTTPAIKSVQYK